MGKRRELLNNIGLFNPPNRNLMFQILFNSHKCFDVAVTDQTEGSTLTASAACSTNSMHIIFRIIRKFKVGNKIHTRDIKTASRQIRGH
jgi:hypothetical protein